MTYVWTSLNVSRDGLYDMLCVVWVGRILMIYHRMSIDVLFCQCTLLDETSEEKLCEKALSGEELFGEELFAEEFSSEELSSIRYPLGKNCREKLSGKKIIGKN
jgi:hypothetical protein